MRGRFASVLCVAVLASVLVQACSEPRSYEQFCREEPFEYSLNISAERSYNVSFYTAAGSRRAAVRRDRVLPPAVELEVEWTSPSNEIYYEQVWLPLSDDGSNAVVRAYRSGLVPPESGKWILRVKPHTPGLRGLGIVCERND